MIIDRIGSLGKSEKEIGERIDFAFAKGDGSGTGLTGWFVGVLGVEGGGVGGVEFGDGAGVRDVMVVIVG